MTLPFASQLLAWLVAAFFLVGSVVNILAPPTIRADYARWGYPAWFHYVTGALELVVVILLFVPGGRFAGAVLASLVMLAAAGTTLVNHEYGRAVAPCIALLLSATLAWSAMPALDG